MNKHGDVILSDSKINFKGAVTELIIKQECFIGICAGVAKDAAESVSNIWVIIDPRIVKLALRIRPGGGGWVFLWFGGVG